MKILITGANGLLGQHLVSNLLQEKKYEVVATGKGKCRISLDFLNENISYAEMDLTDSGNIFQVVGKYKPAIIIHTAAMTQVDECETHKQECYNTNVTGTRFLIEAGKEVNARLIYVSTDFVFDGTSGPYKEDDLPGPVNYYGSTKLAAENAVRESGLHWAIVRTVLLFGHTSGGTRKNIVTLVKDSLENGKLIKVVTDQWRTPTYVGDLAKGIIKLIKKNASGIFHLSGKDSLTPYDMAVRTAVVFGLDSSLIEKADGSTFEQAGKRPLKTGFLIEKARIELEYEPVSFDEGLKKMFSNAGMEE
jgi:dTDP-4-dehydrorhamnose reductase